MTLAAGIYCRISSDPDDTRLGVTRQETDCRALATARGWTVHQVYVDNDRSAYTGKPRPAYTRMLTDLAAGTIGAVVAYHPDRLQRSPRDLEAFIEAVESAGAQVATCSAGELDLSTAAGRMTARVVGAVARHESERSSERVRRKMLELAQAGKPTGGGMRPFGWEDDRVTIREVEAAEIRRAAAMVVAGASIRSVITDWTARGVRTATGGEWRATTVKRVLSSPRNAGLRSHRGVILGEATWPAIITPDTRARVAAVLADNAAKVRRPNRRYLLTGGVAICGLCQARLVARPKADGRRCYVCASSPEFGGCGRIRILADDLESIVVTDLLRRADTATPFTDRTVPIVGPDPLAVLADLEARKAQLAADHYVSGDLSDGRQFRAATAALDDAISTAQAAVAARTADQRHVSERASLRTLGARWEAMDVDTQARTIRVFVDQVTVGPAVRGRNRFDPARVTITWLD